MGKSVISKDNVIILADGNLSKPEICIYFYLGDHVKNQYFDLFFFNKDDSREIVKLLAREDISSEFCLINMEPKYEGINANFLRIPLAKITKVMDCLYDNEIIDLSILHLLQNTIKRIIIPFPKYKSSEEKYLPPQMNLSYQRLFNKFFNKIKKIDYSFKKADIEQPNDPDDEQDLMELLPIEIINQVLSYLELKDNLNYAATNQANMNIVLKRSILFDKNTQSLLTYEDVVTRLRRYKESQAELKTFAPLRRFLTIFFDTNRNFRKIPAIVLFVFLAFLLNIILSLIELQYGKKRSAIGNLVEGTLMDIPVVGLTFFSLFMMNAKLTKLDRKSIRLEAQMNAVSKINDEHKIQDFFPEVKYTSPF